MIRIVAVAAMMLVASSAVAQELVALFDIGNRQGRDLPVVVVRLVLPNNIIVNQLLVRRCDTDSLLPFFIEPIKPANDSLACWVRINNLPRSASIQVKVLADPRQSVSRSSGSATFTVYQDRVTPTTSANASGPFTTWEGTPPAFGSGMIIEACMRATRAGCGLFAFFGLNNNLDDAYVVQHDARPGSADADLYRTTNGTTKDLSGPGKVWAIGDTVLYSIRLRADSILILRTRMSTPTIRDTLRAKRTESGNTWKTFGVANLPGFAGSFAVDWVRARPFLDPEPSVTRRSVEIVRFPSNAVVCGDQPVILTAPSGWTTYEWSNAATGRNATITQPGIYSVTVKNSNGCSIKLPPITVQYSDRPFVGNDTAFSLCLGKSEVLRARKGFARYEWYISTGQTQTRLDGGLDSIMIDSADIYTCIGTSGPGCADTALFRVNRVFDTTARINTPTQGLTICEGDSLVLEAQPPLSSYRWLRDGVFLPDTTQRIIVRDAGIYTVRVSLGEIKNSCVSISSVTVRRSTPVPFDIKTEYQACEGDSIVVTIPSGFTRAVWRDASTVRRRVFTTSDTMTVTASVDGACAVTRRITSVILPSPRIRARSTDGRVSLCLGEELTLEVIQNAPAYVWLRNDTVQGTSKQLTIRLPGRYIASAIYGNGCIKNDTIVIEDGLAKPELIALDGQAICEGDSTRITTAGRFQTYLWSTGETTPTITVTKPGEYSVYVTLFECSATSTILIEPADPRGPGITSADTVSLCGESPNVFVSVTNLQRVPRDFEFIPLSPGFSINEPFITVPPNATARIPITLVETSTPRILPCRFIAKDDCRWIDTFEFTADYGPKDVPVSMVLSTGSEQVRSGDTVDLSLLGFDASGLSRFRWNDTVWLTIRVDPELLQIRSAAATCFVKDIIVNDTAGLITYALSDCGTGTVSPFIEQRLTVLSGTSLSAAITIDSVRGTNPCFSMPLPSRVLDVPIAPYGCELSTIRRPLSPAIRVRGGGDDHINVEVGTADVDITIATVDMLGKVMSTRVVSAGDQQRDVRMPIVPGSWTYVHASSVHGTTTVPVAGSGR
jgi:hypothetical protein